MISFTGNNKQKQISFSKNIKLSNNQTPSLRLHTNTHTQLLGDTTTTRLPFQKSKFKNQTQKTTKPKYNISKHSIHRQTNKQMANKANKQTFSFYLFLFAKIHQTTKSFKINEKNNKNKTKN